LKFENLSHVTFVCLFVSLHECKLIDFIKLYHLAMLPKLRHTLLASRTVVHRLGSIEPLGFDGAVSGVRRRDRHVLLTKPTRKITVQLNINGWLILFQ